MIKSPNPRNKTLYFLHLLSSTERADFKLLIYNENIILNILLLPFKLLKDFTQKRWFWLYM